MEKDKTCGPVADLRKLLCKNPGWEELLDKSIRDASDEIEKKKPINLPLQAKVPEKLDPCYYNYLGKVSKWTPQVDSEDLTRREPYNQLCLFYFLLGQETGKELQEKPVFSDWMVEFATDWGKYLDTPESINEDIIAGFEQAPNYNVKDYFPGPSGWMSFNQFFAREIRPGRRPIDSPSDDSVIVSPADSVCQGQWKIDKNLDIVVNGDDESPHLRMHKGERKIVAKGIRYSIKDLLDGSPYADRFQNGTFMHSFLNTYDYHRFHSPVGGYVREARSMVKGKVALDVTIEEVSAKGTPPAEKVYELEANDPTGYQFQQARGLFIVESPLVGFVATVPIGMAQVSSVTIIAEKNMKIAKGEEFGYFTFGGSDMVILFEPGVDISAITNTKYFVGRRIAEAKNVFELGGDKRLIR